MAKSKRREGGGSQRTKEGWDCEENEFKKR